jgi:O-antigen biosynthesis protein
VVIPNWNGKDLLAKYLPSVVAALAGNPANEIVVVDNGSTDGSAEFVRTAFPQVKLVALARQSGLRRRIERRIPRRRQRHRGAAE